MDILRNFAYLTPQNSGMPSEPYPMVAAAVVKARKIPVGSEDDDGSSSANYREGHRLPFGEFFRPLI